MRFHASPILFALILLVLGGLWSLCLGEDAPPAATGPVASVPAEPSAPAAPAVDVAPAKKEEDPAAPAAGGEEPRPYGQQAYEAYCAKTGWKSLVSGANLPQWAALNPAIQAAWDAAVVPLVDELNRAREALCKDHAREAEEQRKTGAHVTELNDEIRRLKGLMKNAGLDHYSKL